MFHRQAESEIMRILVSPYQNPFINLAIEDYYLRHSDELPILFFYVNRPCVVMGRFQNPWLECNLSYLTSQDIWMVRRQSGGGCVFQDSGNLNYSFIYPTGNLDRNYAVELIKEAFRKADMTLEISPRHDLWLDGCKISGSAYKQIKNSCFHHGTFLVNSDLNRLEESLKQSLVMKESKSIASVRSKVVTLAEKFPGISIEDVIELVSHEVGVAVTNVGGEVLSRPEVQEAYQMLVDEKWLWGETPLFELDGGFKIHKGQVKEPFEGIFNRASMEKHFSQAQLDQNFPDFSKQYTESRLVF